jgi:hypothetical protein
MFGGLFRMMISDLLLMFIGLLLWSDGRVRQILSSTKVFADLEEA